MVEVLCQILIIKRDSEVPTQLAGISNLVRYLLRQKSINTLLEIPLRFLEWTPNPPSGGYKTQNILAAPRALRLSGHHSTGSCSLCCRRIKSPNTPTACVTRN